MTARQTRRPPSDADLPVVPEDFATISDRIQDLSAAPMQAVGAFSNALNRGGLVMAATAIIRTPDEGVHVRFGGPLMTFPGIGNDTRRASILERTIPLRSSTGLHARRVQKKTFHAREDVCDRQAGDQRIGTYLFPPHDVSRHIASVSDRPVRVLMTASSPGHQHHFEEFADTVARGGIADPVNAADLRSCYGADQLSALKN